MANVRTTGTEILKDLEFDPKFYVKIDGQIIEKKIAEMTPEFKALFTDRFIPTIFTGEMYGARPYLKDGLWICFYNEFTNKFFYYEGLDLVATGKVYTGQVMKKFRKERA